MLRNLLQEATNATEEKAFCDTEMTKNTNDRDKFMRRSLRVDQKLGSLEVTRVSLVEEISMLTDNIGKLTEEHATATELRAKESAENRKVIEESKVGEKAVNKAIEVIKNFYRKAKNDWTFLDLKRTTPPPAPEGVYRGKQAASLGIVAMMEVCRDDFIRTAHDTIVSEKDEAEEFAKLDEDTKSDIGSKTTSKQLAEEDLATTINDMKGGKQELKSNVEALDASLETLEELKPRCVDPKESYEERQAKRQEKITALKAVVCTLDLNNVEESCQ